MAIRIPLARNSVASPGDARRPRESGEHSSGIEFHLDSVPERAQTQPKFNPVLIGTLGDGLSVSRSFFGTVSIAA